MTEQEFANWLHEDVLGTAVTGFLKWRVAVDDENALLPPYREPVRRALAVYGAADITAVTDIGKLQKIGKVELWRAVAEATVAEFDWTAQDDGATYNRSQVHRQALAMMNLAMADIAYLYRSLPRYGARTVRLNPTW